jgi:hypothetical protein
MRIDSDHDGGILIEGDEEELEDLADTIREAVATGQGKGQLLDVDAVTQLLVSCKPV